MYHSLRWGSLFDAMTILGLRKSLILLVILAAVTPLLAQGAASTLKNPLEHSDPASGASHDPLGRTSPQEATVEFLEACHARQYAKAAQYLDLRKL